MKQLLTSLGVTNVENLDLGPFTPEAMLIAMLTFLVCLLAIKLVMVLFRKLLSRAHIDERVRRYTLAGIRTVLWIITILIVADSLGIPITSLVALLSVFSLAISLAVQSVLGNIAGGIVIMLNKPFKEGDYIETSSGTSPSTIPILLPPTASGSSSPTAPFPPTASSTTPRWAAAVL